MKGNKLWLARKRDDPLGRIGWIWRQHFKIIEPAETKEDKHDDVDKPLSSIEKSGREIPDYFGREARYRPQPTPANNTQEDTLVDSPIEEKAGNIERTTANFWGKRADFWIPQATPDGRLFYFNTETGKSSTDLPPELTVAQASLQDEDEESDDTSSSEQGTADEYTELHTPTEVTKEVEPVYDLPHAPQQIGRAI